MNNMKSLRLPHQTRMTVEKAKQVYNEHINIITASVYNALFTNDICCGLIIEAVDDMKRSTYYKQKMKRYVNMLDSERRSYEKMMNKIVNGKGLSLMFADFNEKFLESVQGDISHLCDVFKRIVKDEDVKEYELIAKMETARTLCEFSCYQLDQRIRDLSKAGISHNNYSLSYLRLTNISRLLDLIMYEFKPGKKILLDTDECQKALDIVMLKLGDVNEIANAIKLDSDNENN